MDITKLQRNMSSTVCVVFLLLSRLLPHPPNTAPIFCAAFALACFLDKKQVILLSVLALMLSDIALSLVNHYPAFGLWTIFTYSGFIAALFAATGFLTSSLLRTLYALLASTLFFWIWTNFGVWLTSTLYPKTTIGLVNCYVAAIPFLNNAIAGHLAWGLIIFVPLLAYKRRQKFSAVCLT